MMYGYGYGFPHFLGALFWIVIIILVIVYFHRSRKCGTGNSCKWNLPWPDKAMETLKERYAKGEINKEEFEERKSVLMK